MQDVEELERALEFPWDQWTVFLHPAQRQWVDRDHGGPARVSGSAGTGKTIVALHRAVHLARSNEYARVLLTTFSPALAHALHTRLRRLVGRTPMLAERIDVVALDELGERLFKFAFGKPALADDKSVRSYLDEAAAAVVAGAVSVASALPAKLGAGFLRSEWAEVVDPWQINGWESYRDFKRLGRKMRLSEGQRAAAWQVFGRVRDRLRVVRARQPQIVLCDIGLPGMNGLQVAARLREEMEEALPVMVALTGYGQAADRERARALVSACT